MIAEKIEETDERSRRAEERTKAAERRVILERDRGTQAVRDERKVAAVRIAAKTRNVDLQAHSLLAENAELARQLAGQRSEFDAQLRSSKIESDKANATLARQLADQRIEFYAQLRSSKIKSDQSSQANCATVNSLKATASSLELENRILQRRAAQAESRLRSMNEDHASLKEQLGTTKDVLRTSECLRSEEKKKSSEKIGSLNAKLELADANNNVCIPIDLI